MIDTGGFITELSKGLYYSHFYLWELLKPNLLCIALTKPNIILERRKKDEAKPRLFRGETIASLRVKQDILVTAATSHATKLNIPVAYIFNSDIKQAAGDLWSAINMAHGEGIARRLLLKK